jgi:SHS2 domain-containing protein
MDDATHPQWETYPHQADMGVRGYGGTVAEAFANAACAMVSVITEPSLIKAAETLEVRCEAPDTELLLVDWLNAIVYEMAIRKMLFSKFEVALCGTQLEARISGEPIERDRHDPAVEIKGATYTDLTVRQRADGVWVAQCVVDV